LIQELQDLLGTDEVYFQPASDAGTDEYGNSFIFTGITYPCFIMKRNTAAQFYANDLNYIFRPGYEVTYINRDEPDDEMVERVMRRFSNCHYERHFVADNLHHDVFLIYY
jgi:hypothetical protein